MSQGKSQVKLLTFFKFSFTVFPFLKGESTTGEQGLIKMIADLFRNAELNNLGELLGKIRREIAGNFVVSLYVGLGEGINSTNHMVYVID